MTTHHRISFVTHSRPGSRRALNAVFALITGVLVILWPESLYYILGSFLVASGVLQLLLRAPSVLVVLPVVSGMFIFAFPNFIPYFFAFFLMTIGLGSLFTGGLTALGVLSVIAAVLLILFPEIISLIVATFLILYAVITLIALFQARKDPEQIVEIY